MASTYTTRIKAEQQEEFANYDAWGPLLNASLQKLDGGIAGIASYTLSSTKTLTSNNGTDDEASKPVQLITGGSGATINLPAVQRWYFFKNGSSGNAVIQVTGGAGVSVTLPASMHAVVICDGTDCTFLRVDRPWTTISTTATTSGTTATIAIDRSGFWSEYQIIFDGLRHNGAGSETLYVDFVRTSGVYPGALPLSFGPAGASATDFDGALTIRDTLISTGIYTGQAWGTIAPGLSNTATTAIAIATGGTGLWALNWGGTGVQFRWNGGASFTAGSMILRAR